ncbi:MAG: putative sulfate exporter family transporter [Pirellulales bacterium]
MNHTNNAWCRSDDAWAMIMATVLLATTWWCTVPSPISESQAKPYTNSIAPWLTTPGAWSLNPIEAFSNGPEDPGPHRALAVLTTILGCVAVFSCALRGLGVPFRAAVPAVLGIAALATTAWLISRQVIIKGFQLEYVLWAFVGGLVISNIFQVPEWLKPALRGELYIKTGLVLMGAGLLFGTLMKLGPPGILVSWITTPVVLISTYLFGQRYLKIKSRSLNLVLSADMSVCGVSAAVATAAACRAKKEELSIAIGISLAFTIVMMFTLPAVINAVGLDQVVGGAWIGGTVDSTGAVVAAGELVGPVARDVAASVKLIQNVLIGVISLSVAAWWARTDGISRSTNSSISLGSMAGEIWHRMPKFIFGFIGASAVFTYLASTGPEGQDVAVETMVKGPVKMMRSWCFCLGFVSIGLETNVRQLADAMGSWKPVVLYICGQALNLLLTFTMAWLAFRVVFPDVAAKIASGG